MERGHSNCHFPSPYNCYFKLNLGEGRLEGGRKIVKCKKMTSPPLLYVGTFFVFFPIRMNLKKGK
jgi:hypothetical protein